MIIGTTDSDVTYVDLVDKDKFEELVAPLQALDGVDPDDRIALESWAAAKLQVDAPLGDEVGVYVNRKTNQAAVVVWEGA